VGVAVWDRNGRLVAVNDHAAASELPASQAVGALLEDVLDDVATSGQARAGVEVVAGTASGRRPGSRCAATGAWCRSPA
jgi:hypothetical protein